MIIKRQILSGVCSLFLFLASCAAPPQHQTSPSARQFTQSDDTFPIMNWDGLRAGFASYDDPHAGIASLAECNYNTIGFIRAENIPACEKLGLKAILRPAGHPIQWKRL